MEGNKILGKVKIGENDEILISENDIISNKAELLHILESRINHWKAEDVLNIAMAFHNSSDSETFLNILTMSTNPEHSLNLHGTGVVFSINEKKERNLCLLNALASYYILSFIKERDEEKKEQAYNNATTNINRADTIEMCDKRSMINKGFLLFANGQLDVAHQFFSNVLEIQENHILALYGKGAISYNYGKYPEALKYFISILKIAPYSSLPSRMCIGLCHYKLGNIQKAQMAFERQLELDPNNHNCLVYLAIINLNNSIQNCHSKELEYNHSNQSGNLIEIGLKLLEKAHLKNPNNILCLLHLSNHYFLVEKYKKAEKLAKRGLWLLEQYKIIGGSNNYQSNAKGGYKFGDDIKCLRSEIYSMMGKIYHIENNYNKAYKYYSSAVQANPQNFSAIYSLGQCLFYLRNYKEALNSLKSVAAQSLYENDINLLKLLGQCHSKVHEKKAAIENLKKVIEIDSSNQECLLELAQIIELESPEEALEYYKKCLQLLSSEQSKQREKEEGSKLLHWKKERGDSQKEGSYPSQDALPHQEKENDKENDKEKEKGKDKEKPVESDDLLMGKLLNNMGILEKILSHGEEGVVYLKRGIDYISRQNNQRKKLVLVTLEFNLSYVYEQIGKNNMAHDLYKKLSSHHYVDADIRLSHMALARGNYMKAIQYAQNAVKTSHSHNLQARNHLAWLMQMLNQHRNAATLWKQLFNDSTNKDLYALLALANLNFHAASEQRAFPANHQAQLTKAISMYVQVLLQNPNNIYASLGVANVLAEFNRRNEAQDIYNIIRQNHPNLHHPWVNSAHLHAANEENENAITIYKRCLEKFFNGKDDRIELYIARAYYNQKSFLEAQNILQKMVIRNPANLFYKFNLALCLQSRAIVTFNKAIRAVSETRSAIKNVEVACKMFDQVKRIETEIESYARRIDSNPERKELAERAKKADERKLLSEDLLANSSSYLEYDLKKELSLQTLQENQERMKEELISIEQEEKSKVEKEKQALTRQYELENEETIERVKRISEEWISRIVSKEKGKRGKKEANPAKSEDEEEGEEEDEEEEFKLPEESNQESQKHEKRLKKLTRHDHSHVNDDDENKNNEDLSDMDDLGAIFDEGDDDMEVEGIETQIERERKEKEKESDKKSGSKKHKKQKIQNAHKIRKKHKRLHKEAFNQVIQSKEDDSQPNLHEFEKKELKKLKTSENDESDENIFESADEDNNEKEEEMKVEDVFQDEINEFAKD